MTFESFTEKLNLRIKANIFLFGEYTCEKCKSARVTIDFGFWRGPKSLRAGVPLRHTARASCVIQSRVVPWHHLRFQVFEGGGTMKLGLGWDPWIDRRM